MKSNIGFIKQVLILSLILGALGAILFMTVLKAYYLPVFPILLVFFAAMTVFFHIVLVRSLKKSPNKFSIVFMGLSAGKLFLMLIMIVLYLILKRDTVIAFLAGTFLLYLVFTLFEVKTLLRLVQGKE